MRCHRCVLKLKLTIGDCNIPKRFLRHVNLYRAAPVSFGGVLVGNEGVQIKEKLERLTQGKAVSYEAVDEHGVRAEGFCDLRNLKFNFSHGGVTFSGELIRPFEQDLYWEATDQLASHTALSENKSSSLYLGG